MISVRIKRERFGYMETYTEGRWPCEDRGRNWNQSNDKPRNDRIGGKYHQL